MTAISLIINTSLHLPAAALAAGARWHGITAVRGRGQSQGGKASSPVKEGNSPVNVASSPAKEGDSPVNQANSSTQNITSDAALLEIARSIRESGRSMPEEIETTILALCENQFLTVRQIAELLKRKPDNLRERYIATLMQRGLLELRFPSAPNHPDQAYRKRKTT